MRATTVLLALLTATPTLAQERSAAQRETLVELARVMGEAQALHQVCYGPDDPAWRAQFQQMLDVEAPDEAFAKQMNSAFNRGFAARRNEFSVCGPASRIAESEAALEGRDLAAGLAQATVRVAPDEFAGEELEPMAEPAAPR